jgi:hypothetical protein
MAWFTSGNEGLPNPNPNGSEVAIIVDRISEVGINIGPIAIGMQLLPSCFRGPTISARLSMSARAFMLF